MNKAFIFDLDGVLINNEPQWEIAKKEMYTKLFGDEIYQKLGSTVGLNIEAIHKRAIELGTTISREELHQSFVSYAPKIYSETPITEGIQDLGAKLVTDNYGIGIVSASPLDWMDMVIKRLNFKKHVGIVISLNEREDLAHKPEPDGYLEAMKILNADPTSTAILEDSNAGIASAKSARAYVIGLKQNLVEGYQQEGADTYVDKAIEVINVLNKINFH